jgi:hypothetical protein
VIVSAWFEREGRYVAEVFDWCDCWFTGPRPVLAGLVAPPGFRVAAKDPATAAILVPHDILPSLG